MAGSLLAGLLVFAMAPTAEAADEIHFTITSQTSVTFNWRGAESTIRYGTTTAYGQTVTAQAPTPLPYSSAGPFWEARITGLQENTLYHYSIGSGPDHTFRTPIPRGSSGFTVMAAGDIGTRLKYPNVAVVQSLIAADLPAFSLLLGDLTYGNAHGQAYVDHHFNDMMVWSQDTAYMPIWGNHEWDKSTDDLRNYKGRFELPNPQTSPGSPAVSCCGEDWYWFDYGNVRFIGYPEPWSGAWTDWKAKAAPIMDAAQADPKITFIVTFGHRPTLSSGHHPGSATLLGHMSSLATGRSKYVLNLFAHSHNYERSTPQNGVVHVTAGTGGSSLEQDGSCLWLTCTQPAWSAFRAMRLGPLKLTFTATGIKGQFICGPSGGGTNDVSCTLGSVVDTFTIGSAAGDTTLPSASMTAPAAGATLVGTVSVAANASDNVGVAGVQFKLDGNNLGAEDLMSPYTVSWDTTTVANGSHALTAVARDAAGNRGTSTAVTVNVSNTGGAAPSVTVTLPLPGASLTGTKTVSATASDDVGVVGVQFKVDGNNLGIEDLTSPYSISWNTATASNGSHTLTAVARDGSGNSTTSSGVTVTVANVSTSPAVSISAPSAGATVTATATVSANATDDVGVLGVQFKLDGSNLGAEDTTAPYATSWDSTAATNGLHTLTAVARDAAGNATTSAGVTVTVANLPTAPAVSLTSPVIGSTLSGTVAVLASATDDIGVVGVQFRLDGAALGAEDATSPFSVSWDTTATPDGPHSLTAVARDGTGNSTTSAAVPVIVLNTVAAGLITDPNRVFSVPQVPKPGYLTPIVDPTFRTTVRRVAHDPSVTAAWTGPPSGSGTWGTDTRQHYSKDQPWSSDGSLISLENRGGSPTAIYLDGDTYQLRYGRCSNYSLRDDRWHPSREHPKEKINAGGTELMWFNVATCTKTRTWTLPFAIDYFGSGEGNPSHDGRFVALSDATRVFVVDMDPQPPDAPYPNKRIGPAFDVTACGLSDCSIDWVSISPSGKYVVISYNGDHPRVLDVNPSTLELTTRPTPAAAPQCSGHNPAQGYIFDLGHADMALNPFDNNEDVLIGQQRSWCPSTVGGTTLGKVIMVKLSNGQVTTLTTPGNEAQAHHISTRNTDRPGWVYVGYYPSAGQRFDDEIVAIKIDGSRAVERLAHKHSAFSGCYRCESHAVPSRDGKRVLWASNWAQNCGSVCGPTSDIKAYILDTRALSTTDTTPPAAPGDLRRVNP